MLAAGGGVVINMSSVCSSIKGAPNRSSYGISKAAGLRDTDGIKGKCPLENRQYQVFSTPPTLSPSLEGTSPIRHPTGPHQRPKSTLCTPAIARFTLVDHLMGIKGKCPLENRQYQVFSTPPTLSPSLDGTSPIRHPTGPHQRPKSTQRTPAIARFPLVDYFEEALAESDSP